MLKIYLALIILGVLSAAGAAGFYYYKDSQERIRILTQNTAKLELAKTIQDQTIDTLKADANKYRKLNKSLSLNLQKSHDYKNKLIGKLRRHDLSRLSQSKPKIVEGKINRGTKLLFQGFESDTALPVSK
jgi:type II secretory pathway pseudopilin PulG